MQKCFFLFVGNDFNRKKIRIKTKKMLIFTLSGLITSFIIWVVYNSRIITVILCIFILTSLLQLGIILSNKIKSNFISINSMTIYLLHWPFMLLVRIIMHNVLNMNYYIVVLSMLTSGLLFPYIVIKIIKKYKIDEKYSFIRILLGF